MSAPQGDSKDRPFEGGWKVPAHAAGISQCLSLTAAFAHRQGIKGALRSRLLVVVEEVVRNTVLHGRPPADTLIHVALRDGPGGIAIDVRDRGKPFDPRVDLPVPAAPREAADHQEGGTGWRIVLTWCDLRSYEHDAGENRLSLLLRPNKPW